MKPPRKPSDPLVAAGLALLVLLVIAATRPLSGAPLNDDFSYARTAAVFARSGHIVYNGWGSPILLPQIYVGALLIKLFGFSYLVLDLFGVACAAVATALMFLLARACGLSVGLSALVTLVLTLNPVFLGVAPTFMTDIPSLALLLAALLLLVKALKDDGIAARPFAISVALAVVAGANRQVSWLAYFGGLATVYALLPPARRAIRTGALALILVAGMLTIWFSQQPYVVPIPLRNGILAIVGYTEYVAMFTYRLLIILGLMLVPFVAVGFHRPRTPRGWVRLLILLFVSVLPAFWPLGTRMRVLGVGFFGMAETGKYLTSRGIIVGGMHGLFTQPKVIGPVFGDLLSLIGAIGFALSVFQLMDWWLAQRRRRTPRTLDSIAVSLLSSTAIIQILGSIIYFAETHIADRFLLFYLPGLGICLLAQAQAKPKLTPAAMALCGATTAFMAILGYGFTATYMNYVRTQAALYRELRAEGVPAIAIDGGFEYNADTQVAVGGRINNETMVPFDAYDPDAKGRYIDPLPQHFPVLDVQYILSLEPSPKLPFAVEPEPVKKRTFASIFPPTERTMYVLRVVR